VTSGSSPATTTAVLIPFAGSSSSRMRCWYSGASSSIARAFARLPLPTKIAPVLSLPPVAGGFIYTVSGHCSPGCSAIIAVNAQTGRIVWQHIGDRGGSGVMVASDRVYTAGATDTYVYAARTGALHHHVPWEGLWTGDAKRAFVLASYTGPRVLAAGAGV
jgi:outer membrane protein assembly factor BamB